MIFNHLLCNAFWKGIFSMQKSCLFFLMTLLLSACTEKPETQTTDKSHEIHESAAVHRGVEFKFPNHFGRAFSFTAELIAKQNDYYSQNLVESPFYLSVLSVEDVALDTPVRIEPSFPSGIAEGFTVGDTVHWQGYERLREIGSTDPDAQIDLHYVNQLVITKFKTD